MAKSAWPDWRIYIRDRAACVYCGLDGTADIRNWRQLQIDHVVPRKLSGPDDSSNKVVSCVRCNVLKGDQDPRAMLQDKSTQTPSVLVAAARKLIQDRAASQDELLDYEHMLAEIVGESCKGS